jgi:formamidopyrimidine-DNA glycosylase
LPELPEVETIRRQLEPELMGATLLELEILDPRWCAPHDPGRMSEGCAGRRIEAFERRGKYLVLRLEGGRALVMHLRMTGNLLLDDGSPEPGHLRAVLRLNGDRRLLFTDVRRFGQGVLLEPDEIEPFFRARLGVEPLSPELTASALGELAAGRAAPLKSFLLTQDRVAGIGNIYADEALFRARLHPLSPAGSMREEHCEQLREGIVGALEAGLSGGGASIDDYRDSRGERGTMQDEFLVHRREGLPCPRCGEPVSRIVLGGRSTYLCARCQVRLRRRPRRPRRKPERSRR